MRRCIVADNGSGDGSGAGSGSCYGSGDGYGISRQDASKIRQGIAEALGMDDETLAIRLSEYFQAHEPELTEKTVAEFLRLQTGE